MYSENKNCPRSYFYDLTSLKPWPVSSIAGGNQLSLILFKHRRQALQSHSRFRPPHHSANWTTGYVIRGKYMLQWLVTSLPVGRCSV